MQSGPRQINNTSGVARSFHAFVIVFLLAALVFSVAEAIGLAWSDVLYSTEALESVQKAASMEPGNADHLARLAELEERAGEDPRPVLREAIDRRPDDSELLIRLGLVEEAAGRTEGAEDLLLRAAGASRKYQPRWTLANFYFRRGEKSEFWHWAREALAVSYGDRTPVFRLCWAMEPDPDVISNKAIPDRRVVRLAWMNFLFSEQQLPAAAALAEELAREASTPETNALLGATDTLLREGDYGSALSVWNQLCVRRLVPASPVDPRNGSVITNGDFATAASSRGFGWRASRTEGVFLTQSTGRWTVALSGSQPERRELLTQYVALAPGGRYRLSAKYRSRSAGMLRDVVSSGLRWRVRTQARAVLGESEELNFDGEGISIFEFLVPEDVTGALVVLHYERASGTMRMEGSVELEEVRLEGV